MKSLLGNRKLVITIFVVLILASSALAFGPLVFSLVMGRGVKTEPVNAERTQAATTDLEGEWNVVKGSPYNFTSAGFTIDEILPADKRTTSGSTKDVTGQATIKGSTVEDATITVDMATLTTDKKVRDQNMKSKLFETQLFPEASFELTKPASLADVPDDGTIGTVKLTGDLTIKDETHEISQDFDVLRDGDQIVIGGTVPVDRLDYGVETPEMLAAKVEEKGEVNLRISFEKN